MRVFPSLRVRRQWGSKYHLLVGPYTIQLWLCNSNSHHQKILHYYFYLSKYQKRKRIFWSHQFYWNISCEEIMKKAYHSYAIKLICGQAYHRYLHQAYTTQDISQESDFVVFLWPIKSNILCRYQIIKKKIGKRKG